MTDKSAIVTQPNQSKLFPSAKVEPQLSESAVYVVAPCFNENVTCIKFLDDLQNVLAESDKYFVVVIVDDASLDNTLELLQNYNFSLPTAALKVISVRYNLGHQGAIYQGLLYAQQAGAEYVIVMDSDGEDDPSAVLELVKYQHSDSDIINVVRGKRKEKLSFRLFYAIYKLIFFFITKRSMNFGNYSMINRKIIDSVIDTSFIHYAAHLSKQKAKTSKITFDRRKRIDGHSKMSLNTLVHHAFKSFIEYAEDLLMVFLKLFLLITVAIAVLIVYIVYIKLFTDDAIMGWASTLSVSLFSTSILCLGFFVIGILLLNIMSRRDTKHKKELFKVIK